MTEIDPLPRVELTNQKSYRLINSKFPPIAMFDDVANAEEFDILYEIQSLTNPRIQTEVGNLQLVAKSDIPFGISGCSYATAPFTHVNPEGSRFSNGDYGVLYLADTIDTAIAETRYHQNRMLTNIQGLHYDVITMRGLSCIFSNTLIDITDLDDGLYHKTNYSAAQTFGLAVRNAHIAGLQYCSVRRENSTCWALMSPKNVQEIKQTKHFEFIFDGSCISQVKTITKITP